MVAIRAEKDPKVIREMTPAQKKIRSDWAKRSIKKYTDAEYIEMQKAMAAGFRTAFT